MKKRILSLLLILCMAVTLLPTAAFAAGSGDGEAASSRTSVEKDNGPVHIEKSVNADETELTLEAYLTNEVTQTVSVKPLDIVLVLDQSGSMGDDFNGKNTNKNTDRRQYAMKQAVNSFIDKVGEQYSEKGDHRMAIVIFDGNAKTWQGWTVVDAAGKSSLKKAVDRLPQNPAGATNVGAGMQAAETLMGSGYAYAGSNMERQKVVIVFTDGVPTTTDEFDTDVANSAITAAKSMKDAGVTVYTVGIFNGANPDQLYGNSGFDKNSDGSEGSNWSDFSVWMIGDIKNYDVPAGNRFLNYLSSNFDATNVGLKKYKATVLGIGYHGWEITKNFDRAGEGSYYLTADSSSGLNTIFQQIIEEISTLKIEAGTDAVLSDTLSEYFALNVPEGTDAASAITAEKWDCTGKDADGNYTWKKADTQPAMTKITGKTINVTGFDYTKNAVTATTKGGATTYSGAKLVVTIPIQPDTACTAWQAGEHAYPTNSTAAGNKASLSNYKDKDGTAVDPTLLDQSPEANVTAYTVSYDWNLPEGVTAPSTGLPVTRYYIARQNYTIDNGTYPDIEDDKTIYCFVGWTIDGTNKVTGEQTMGTRNVVVKALWSVETKPDTYTIVFDANGGKWSAAPSGYTMNEGNTTATIKDLASSTKVGAAPVPANGSMAFKGWSSSTDAKDIVVKLALSPTVGNLMYDYDTDKDNTVTFYAIWEDSGEQPDQLTYTIRQRFMRNDGPKGEDGAVNYIELGQAAKGTMISTLINDLEKDWKFGSPSQTYLYDNTKTKVNDVSDVAATSKLETSGTVIDLYYYLDENEDKIPDYTQIFISYQSGNLLYGTVTPEKKVVITLNDSNKNGVTVTDDAQVGTATPRENYAFVKWVNGSDGNAAAYSKSRTLTPTITDPIGGTTYVFTAFFKPAGQNMGTLNVTKVMTGKNLADLPDDFALLVKNAQDVTVATLMLHGDNNKTVYVSDDGHWSLDLTPGDYTIEEVSADIDGYDLTTTYTQKRNTVSEGATTSVTVTNSYMERGADLVDDAIAIYHKASGQSDWHGGNAYADASAHQAGRTPTISYKAELDLSEMKLQMNKRTASIIAAYGEKPWEKLVEAVKAAQGSLAMFSGSEIVLHVQLDKQLSTADIQNQLNNITVTSGWFELSNDGNPVVYDKNAQSLTITCVPKNKADGYSSTITLSGLNDLSLTSILSSGEIRTLTASGYITGSILISVPTVEVNAVTVETEDLVDAVQHGNGELYLNESIPLVLGSKTATNTAKLYWKEIKDNDDNDDTYYYLAIKKVDAQDGHALNGATFELYQLDKNGKVVNRSVATTRRQGSENGIALFSVDNKNSYEGIWYYAEVTAPEGYVLDSTEHKIKAKNFSDSLSTAVKNADTVRNYRGTTPDLLNDNDHFAYVIGYMDGNVRPYGLISRAETTTIFFRLLKDSVRDGNLLTSNTYTDVADDYWANTAISTMTGLGIVQGRSTTTFDPKAPITRAQFAAICARFDTGKSNGEQTFSDIQGHWAEKYIERAAELGWIKGFEDGTFRPDTYITRAQAMTMINRVLNRIPEDESDLLPGMNVWPDCNPGDWFYLTVQEATNSHDFKHKAGNYETWTKLMKNPDWTRYEN